MEVRKPIPVILDVDPGVDDALAIILALQCKNLDVRGITACFGNRQLWRTLRNALQLVELMGRDIPVAKGASEPLCKPLREYDGPDDHLIHGLEGLGPVVLPAPTHHEVELPAPDFIAELLRQSDEPITLIPVGPLTNIARFVVAYPELLSKVRAIHLMGGAAVGGNVTPYVEANIYSDPEAAATVFACGVPIVMCGLDATLQCLIYPDEEEALIQGEHTHLAQLAHDMLSVYEKGEEFPGSALHDSLAVASVFCPDIITTKDCYVDICLTPGEHRGQTVVDLEGRTGRAPNVKVALSADRLKMLDLLRASLNGPF